MNNIARYFFYGLSVALFASTYSCFFLLSLIFAFVSSLFFSVYLHERFFGRKHLCSWNPFVPRFFSVLCGFLFFSLAGAGSFFSGQQTDPAITAILYLLIIIVHYMSRYLDDGYFLKGYPFESFLKKDFTQINESTLILPRLIVCYIVTAAAINGLYTSFNSCDPTYWFTGFVVMINVLVGYMFCHLGYQFGKSFYCSCPAGDQRAENGGGNTETGEKVNED